MICLKRRLGTIPAGTVTDALCKQAERELVRIGAAEDVVPASDTGGVDIGPSDLSGMTRRELVSLANERGIEVPAKATKAQIAEALGGAK